MAGVFITLEGIEGAGKSTQAQNAYEMLSAKNPGNVILTREPGGTETGEAIRNIILHATEYSIDGITELLLIFAGRYQHIQDVIAPALSANKIVLCDRFTDATFAYQGGGRGVDMQLVSRLQEIVQGEFRPDLTFLLDTPEEVGRERIENRNEPDRFEAEPPRFFKRVRKTYLDLAREFPERIHVINAAQGVDEVKQEIHAILSARGLC